MIGISLLYWIVIGMSLVAIMRLVLLAVLADIYDVWQIRQHYQSKPKSRIKYPLVSVLIPAYNEEKSIVRTVKSVLATRYPRLQIVVVNDGSTDKTGEILKTYLVKHKSLKNNVVYVEQTNGGKARALNNALVNYAQGKLIMCLDADSRLDPKAIQQAVSYFCNPEVVGLAANVKIINNGSLLSLMQQLEYLLGHHYKKAYTILQTEYIIGGVGSMFRREALAKCHYYDTDTITEDIDLTLKLVHLGKSNKLVFANDVIAYTEGAHSLYALFRQRYRWRFGRMQTFLKNRHLFFNRSQHYNKLLTWVYLPFTLVSEIALLIDPLLLLLLFTLAFLAGDFSDYLLIGGFVAFYTTIAINADRKLAWQEKALLFLAAPLAGVFFLVLSLVEFVTLLKVLINYRKLLYPDNTCHWVPVVRLGL